MPSPARGSASRFSRRWRSRKRWLSGDLRLYQAEHRHVLSRPTFMAEMILSLDRFPRLRRRTLRTLVSRPAIFANLLAMHVGALSPVDFFWNGVVPLGWRVLTARGV